MAAKAQKGRVALVKAAKATVEAVADVVVIGFTTRQIPGIGRSSKDGVKTQVASRDAQNLPQRKPVVTIVSFAQPTTLRNAD